MTAANNPGPAFLEGASSASKRANQLPAKFEQANADAIATVERLSDADWQKITGEGWTVAACAHHVAAVHEGIAGFIKQFADGSAPPRPAGMEAVDESNVEHAREYADCSRAAVLAGLRSEGAAAAAIVRGFSDEQLDRSAVAVQDNPAVTTRQLIEMVLIGHVREHVESIKQTTRGGDQG